MKRQLCKRYSVLDAFNRQFPGRQEAEIVGRWSIGFTGFKCAEEAGPVMGQWCAWPASKIDRRALKDRTFFVQVPGLSCHESRDQEIVDIAPTLEGATFHLGDFSDANGCQRVQQSVAVGRDHLLQLLSKADLTR